ncbi:MAG: aminotransferase class IV [Clostridia bacterium]|nr:aminotransferase class IV [Clostridia bacterium]
MADGVLTGMSTLEQILARDRLEVYEVIRLSDGKPLFVKEHYDRMFKSLSSIGKAPVLSLDEFIGQIDMVAKANDMDEGNLRIEQYREPDETTEHTNIYPIPYEYPTAEMYAEGVEVAFMQAERDNPQAKIFNADFRQQADSFLAETGVAEVLLVNRNGEITEGSRSNVFFVKEGTVVAAPQHTVLPGITRMKVLQIFEEDGIKYEERPVMADSAGSFDAAFLTGTSKEVLPIRKIEDACFDVNHPILRHLMRRYREMAEANTK